MRPNLSLLAQVAATRDHLPCDMGASAHAASGADGKMYSRSILTLPIELLSDILVCLDWESLLACSETCKELHALVSNSTALQYKIELALNGMIDVSSSNQLTSADRLDRLRTQQSGWRRLKSQSYQCVSIPGNCHAYEFVGGVFGKVAGPEADNGLGNRRFSALWLPSSTQAEGRRLNIPDMGFPIKDFAMDPTQGLVAFLEMFDNGMANDSEGIGGIHLRSLAAPDRTAHPRAAVPLLTFFVESAVLRCMIDIAYDAIALFGYETQQSLDIWNWRTGDQLVHLHPADLPDDARGFSFVSPRAYLLTVLEGGGAIYLYTFGDPFTRHERKRKGKLVAMLTLPPLAYQDMELEDMWSATGPWMAGSPTNVTFTTAPDSRIHVFTLNIGSPRLTVKPLCLVMHNRTFLTYIDVVGRSGSLRVDWREWGPIFTRVFELGTDYEWLRYVHGQRMVCTLLDDENQPHVHVLDFNVHPKHALEQPPASSEDGGLVRLITAPTTVDLTEVYQYDIESNLPFRSVEFKSETNYIGYMVDQERLLGLKANPDVDYEDLDVIDVYSF